MKPRRPTWSARTGGWTTPPKRQPHRISIEALNINGVEFAIRLPTARHRLESSDMEPDADIKTKVERLDEQFRTPMNQ